MRRESAGDKQILPQLRNEFDPANAASHGMPQMRQIHPGEQQVLP
jgi:hypothetical protein